MIILAVDTAGPICAACIFDGTQKKNLSTFSENIGRGHAEHLPSVVDRVLHDAQLSFDKITHLAVTEGPGSFAGIRVGISFVRALALGLKKPALGVSSLKAMAYSVARQHNQDAMALLDARRGEVYLSATNESGDTVIEPSAVKLDDAVDMVIAQKMIICGNGVEPLQDLLNETGEKLVTAHQDASPPIEIVAQIALTQFQSGQYLPPKPQYLRQADAKPQMNFALDRI